MSDVIVTAAEGEEAMSGIWPLIVTLDGEREGSVLGDRNYAERNDFYGQWGNWENRHWGSIWDFTNDMTKTGVRMSGYDAQWKLNEVTKRGERT